MTLLALCAQAEAGKHSKALGQEAAHLRRLGLGDDDITVRMDHRCICSLAVCDRCAGANASLH